RPDGLLSAPGPIDPTPGGPAVDLYRQPFRRRRTVSGFIDRQNLPAAMRTFDFASPDAHCPQRFTTTVPQQALFLMNSPFVQEQARELAQRADAPAPAPAERVRRLYRFALARNPAAEEMKL